MRTLVTTLPLTGRVAKAGASARLAGWGEDASATFVAQPPPLTPPRKGEGNTVSN
jgi:hypothetical protein